MSRPDLPDLDQIAMRLVQLRHRGQDLTRLVERAEERHYQFPSDAFSSERSTTCAPKTPRSGPRSSCSRSRSAHCSAARRRRSVAAEGRSGGGRRVLGRVVLVSLADRARAELDERRARGQRLRAHRALRRLEELERALDRFDRGLRLSRRRGTCRGAPRGGARRAPRDRRHARFPGCDPRPVGRRRGGRRRRDADRHARLVRVAVARRAPREGAASPHPNEGSSGQDEGR